MSVERIAVVAKVLIRFGGSSLDEIRSQLDRAWEAIQHSDWTAIDACTVRCFVRVAGADDELNSEHTIRVVLNAGYLELRTDHISSAPTLEKLSRPFTRLPALTDVNLEVAGVFQLRSGEPVDFASLLAEPMRNLVSTVEGANDHITVDAVGHRFYLRYGEHHGAYTLDVYPDIIDPARQMFLRLRLHLDARLTDWHLGRVATSTFGLIDQLADRFASSPEGAP